VRVSCEIHSARIDSGASPTVARVDVRAALSPVAEVSAGYPPGGGRGTTRHACRLESDGSHSVQRLGGREPIVFELPD
jgi:hypothetical protein